MWHVPPSGQTIQTNTVACVTRGESGCLRNESACENGVPVKNFFSNMHLICYDMHLRSLHLGIHHALCEGPPPGLSYVLVHDTLLCNMYRHDNSTTCTRKWPFTSHHERWPYRVPATAGSYVDVVACDDSLVTGVCVEGSQTFLYCGCIGFVAQFFEMKE